MPPTKNRRRRGFSLIELLIVIAIILIIITVAVPKFQKAQVFARDMGAQKAIQTIHQMEVQYQSQYGRYANSLAELGPPASGAATPAAADLIDATLAGGVKAGYKYTLTGGNGGYVITAVPESFGSSGSRTWYSDQTMTIHYNPGPEPATANSPEVGSNAAK
jgi:prepilin-type N-terminal cleavage/methylation domain-containing protein